MINEDPYNKPSNRSKNIASPMSNNLNTSSHYKIEDLLSENKKLKEKLIDADRNLQMLNERHILSQKGLQQEFDKRFREILNEFQKKTIQIVETNDRLQNELYNMQKLAESNADRDDQLNYLMQENERLSSNLERERIKDNSIVLDSKKFIDDHERYVDNLANEKDHYRQQYEQVLNNMSNLEKGLINEQARVTALFAELSEKDQQIIDLRKQNIQDLKMSVRDQEAQVATQSDENLNTFQSQGRENETSMVSNVTMIRIKEENVFLAERLNELRSDNERLKNRLEFFENEYKSSERTSRMLNKDENYKRIIDEVTKPWEQMKSKMPDTDIWNQKIEEERREKNNLKDQLFILQKREYSERNDDDTKDRDNNKNLSDMQINRDLSAKTYDKD